MLKADQADNIPPAANYDTATTGENTPVDINVIANDTDPDGTIDPATVTITGNPTNGTAVAHTDGTVTYTPDTGFDGTDTFPYTGKDNEGATSNQSTVTVTVNPGSVTEFTAYNDLAWATGQFNNYITVYTTGQSGFMKDYATGIDTAVTLMIAGGGAAITTQGSNANSGTDAYNVFIAFALSRPKERRKDWAPRVGDVHDLETVLNRNVGMIVPQYPEIWAVPR